MTKKLTHLDKLLIQCEIAERVINSLPKWMKDIEAKRQAEFQKELARIGCHVCTNANKRECYCG